ncbi:MAG: hypothetical protein FD167_11 [bacterium]|nr:MAG: hypothetical protein FD167_11 [bacterium]
MSSETKMFSLSDLHGGARITGLYFTITVIEGTDFGLIFPIEKEQTLIGRKDQGDLPVDIELNDDQASRRHLMLVKRSLLDKTGYVVAVDLESKNGTFVNGKAIVSEGGKKEVDLYSGDKIQIGNTVLKYEIRDTLETSYQERLYQQVTRDAQTGLWNNNYAEREMEKLLSIGQRNGSPFSVLISSIDFLQTLNETYGRNIGDALLRAVAKTIMSELSDYEIASRHKGNEFLIMLPETDLSGASNKAERIRQAIESFDFTSVDCPQKVTLSVGISQFPVCGHTAAELTKQADQALYRAQQVGRNRVMLAEIIAKEKRNLFKPLVTILIFLVVAVVLYFGVSFYNELLSNQKKQLIFSGTVQLHEVQVGSKVGGRVKEVLVKEGDMVKEGQPLVRFDVSELLAERRLIEAEIEQSQANLQKLKNGSRKEEVAEAIAAVATEQALIEGLRKGSRSQDIAQAKVDLSAARAELNNVEASFNRISEVYKQGYESKQNYEDAQAKVILAKAGVDSLVEKVSLLEEGTRKEDIKVAEQRYQQAMAKQKLLQAGSRLEDILAAEAQVQASKAKLAKLDVQIAENEVKAPAQSRVNVIDIRPGDILAANKPVAKLLEQDQIWVRVYVPQTDIGYIKVGQNGIISVDSFQKQKFTGYIEQIAEEAEFYPRNVQTRTDREHQVFAVKVHINNNKGELKSGMSADVEFNSK